MIHSQDQHPRLDELQAFLSGKLSADRRQAVEQHVQTCTQCVESLEHVPEDTLIVRLRSDSTIVQEAALVLSAVEPSVPAALAQHPRYRVVRVLGQGGMGVVYLAEHKLMERPVALKVISQSLAADPQLLQRFVIEARAAARLDHPNIVRAFDAEQADNVHFLVMEYVQGQTLDRLVTHGGPFAVGLACQVIMAAARGLQHAHEQGMVHRDIKPSNLIIGQDGTVKILDFGLARLAAPIDDARPRERLTRFGAVLGTPDYIAPEQTLDSRSADIRADIYSLGCTFYFLLTAQPPFPVGSSYEKLLAHTEQQPRSVTQFRGDVPPELLAVLERMTAKKPADRYATPGDVAAALAPFAAAAPARPRSSRGLVAASVLVLLALLSGLLLRQGCERLPEQHAVVPQPPAAPTVKASARTGNVLVVIPHKSYYAPDVTPFQTVLERGGLRVKLASSSVARALSHDGKETMPVDLLMRDARAADFDAVIFSGSPRDTEFTTDTPAATDAKRFVEEMLQQDKYVTSICRGVEALGRMGVLKGKRIARSGHVPPGFAQQHEAEMVDEPFVAVGQLITGRNPQDAETLAQEILRLLRGK